MFDATPTRYRDPLSDPDPEALATYARLFPGFALPRRSVIAERLRLGLCEGDELADAWFSYARSLPRAEASALVERAARHGVGRVPEAPAALRALFAQLEHVPSWVDFARIDAGARVFRRAGPLGQIVLSELALMGGYRSQAVVKPLAMTGRLREAAGERLMQTARFVLGVAKPGALRLHAEGYRAAIQVRLVHAAVRAQLRQSPRYHEVLWGVPINQSDMLGTNLSFSVLLLAGARKLGLYFNERDADALVHLWRYVGYLCGVREELLPDSERQAAEFLFLVAASQPGPDADSVALARALHEAPLRRARTPAHSALLRGYLSFRAACNHVLLGERVCGELGLPSSRFVPALRALVPLIRGAEWLREHVPALDRIATERAGALLDAAELGAMRAHA